MKKKVKKQITIKSFICSVISLLSCISLFFVCLFPVKKVYAEGEAGTLQQGKNILTLLLGQMGIELVGSIAAIDQYVQEGWQLFLNGLSSPITQEAYTLTAIAGMVQWDDVNNVLSIPSDLYNLVSQWALDLSNLYDVQEDTEYFNIGTVIFPDDGMVMPSKEGNTITLEELRNLGYNLPRNSSGGITYFYGLNDVYTKFAFYTRPNNVQAANLVFVIGASEYNRLIELGNVNNIYYLSINTDNNNSVLYHSIDAFNAYSDIYYNSIISNYIAQKSILINAGYTVYDNITAAVNSIIESSAVLEDNIYVNGNALLDDRIFSTDSGAQLELDPVLNQGITYTLDDVLTAVMDWVTSNTWPDMTTVFVDALPIALEEPIDTVLIPAAPYVEVPQILLPSNLPIIYNPECESLSGCLVAGISAVSNDITSFYNSNESVRNYANIILFVGVSFVALGVIRRHL